MNSTIYATCGIPPRCFTCGRVISNLYEEFQTLLQEKNKKNNIQVEAYQHNEVNNRDIIKAVGLDDRMCCVVSLLTYPKNLTTKL